MPTTYNWKQFITRITVAASTDRIFTAWTTQDGLENWFLRLAEFKLPEGELRGRQDGVQQGDQYRWLWHGYDDSTAERGEILSSNGRNELQFSFSGGCIVKVSVKHENGEAICELQQTMPMDDESEQRHFYIECGKGWTFYMTNLKSTLEGGIDLRNKNAKIQDVINA